MAALEVFTQLQLYAIIQQGISIGLGETASWKNRGMLLIHAHSGFASMPGHIDEALDMGQQEPFKMSCGDQTLGVLPQIHRLRLCVRLTHISVET